MVPSLPLLPLLFGGFLWKSLITQHTHHLSPPNQRQTSSYFLFSRLVPLGARLFQWLCGNDLLYRKKTNYHSAWHKYSNNLSPTYASVLPFRMRSFWSRFHGVGWSIRGVIRNCPFLRAKIFWKFISCAKIWIQVEQQKTLNCTLLPKAITRLLTYQNTPRQVCIPSKTFLHPNIFSYKTFFFLIFSYGSILTWTHMKKTKKKKVIF